MFICLHSTPTNQNRITKRTQSDPLFSTRAENESQIPPTEARRPPCPRNVIRVQPDATRSQILRMLHPLRGGAHASRRTQIRLRNEANSSFLFNKDSKWKPNSVGARLRQHPRRDTNATSCNTLKQNRCNPAVATRFTPNHSPKWLLPKFPGSSDSTCPKRRGQYETKGSTRNWLRSSEERRAALPNRPGPRQPTVASIAERRSGVTQPKHRPARQLL